MGGPSAQCDKAMHTAAFSDKVEAIRALAEMKGDLQAQDVSRGGGVERCNVFWHAEGFAGLRLGGEEPGRTFRAWVIDAGSRQAAGATQETRRRGGRPRDSEERSQGAEKIDRPGRGLLLLRMDRFASIGTG